MANGSGGSFDGDGSIRWEVTTVEDEISKIEEKGHGQKGRKCKGADIIHGEFFKLDFIVPEVWTDKFLEQFAGAPGRKAGDVVTIYLPVLKVPKQIELHWSKGIVPPQGGLSGGGGMTSK